MPKWMISVPEYTAFHNNVKKSEQSVGPNYKTDCHWGLCQGPGSTPMVASLSCLSSLKVLENIDVKIPELSHRVLELFSSLWLDKIDHCDTLCVPCKSGLFIITPILRVLVPLSYILYPLKWVWQIYWMSQATPQYAMHYIHGILLVTAKWSGANQYGWTIQTNDQLWYSL